MEDDLSFDEVAEFLETAGRDASLALVLELLKDAVEGSQALMERLEWAETRIAALEQQNWHGGAIKFDHNTIGGMTTTASNPPPYTAQPVVSPGITFRNSSNTYSNPDSNVSANLNALNITIDNILAKLDDVPPQEA